MSLVRLGDVCTVISGSTPKRHVPEYWGGDIPWVTPKEISHLGSRFLLASEEQISEEGFKSCSTAMLPTGSLLLSSRAPIGLLAINKLPVCTNQGFKSLVPGKAVNVEYLYYVLKANTERLQAKGNGATFKELSKSAVEDFQVPLPPLNDQIHIAHLLGKVEGLIARRKQQLEQLDALLKSVFLEMFGDPVRNEKDWDKAPLEKLGSINRGVSKHRPRNDPQLLGGNHPLIQTGEVSNAGTYITTYTQTYSDIGFAQSKRWPAGTLCITIAANIAQTGILTFDACFPDSVVGFAADKAESNTLYVLGLFWFFQAILEKNAPAAAQKNINLEILRGLEVPKPPVELQNQFADAAEKIEALKSRYQQTLTDLETLYATLSQSAFKGELDLSRIPLPAAAPEPMPTEAAPVIVDLDVSTSPLPDLGLTAGALADEAGRLALLTAWLEAWQTHLGTRPFGLPAFLDAAQTRLQTLYPESERELGMAAYEQIKDWVSTAHASS